MSDTESIILRRVRKLRALAEKAGTEAEAAAAASAAVRLLAKYRLTEAQLAVSEHRDTPREKIDRAYSVNSGDIPRKRVAWHGTLLHGLEVAFGVRYYLRAGSPVLFGRESSVQTAAYVFAYLVREIDRLATERAYQESCAGNRTDRRWHHSYKLGAAESVAATLRASRAAEVAARKEAAPMVEAVPLDDGSDDTNTAPVTALVRQAAISRVEEDEQEVAAEYARFTAAFRTATALRGASSYGAYRAGQQDGRGVKINAARGGLGAGAKRIEE